MLGAFPKGESLPYLDYENIATILDKLGKAVKDKPDLREQFIEKLFVPILDSISQKSTKSADLVLAAILKAVPAFKSDLQGEKVNLKCITKWLSVALRQK